MPALPAQPAMPTPPTRQAVPLQSSSAPPVAKAAAQPETPPASYFAAAAAAAAAVAKSAPEQRTAEPARSGDDLTRIRAIDIETQKRLREIGIHSFADIAKWTPADVGRVSQTLGTSGRIEKENWVEQAQILVRGSEGMDAGRKADVADKQRPAPQPASTFGSPFGADRLHRIIGICGDTEKLLNANGVTRFADIASWTGTEIEKIEALLGKPGRVGLENWVEQAKILSRSATGEDLRATKLDEAIRNNAAKPAAAVPPAMPAAAVPPAPGPQLATPAAAPGGHAAPRDVAHLRSVRSEALRREPLGAAASAIGVFDDLKRIRGVGMLIEKKLNSLGITAYEQIANWTGADIDRISQVLDFKGRIERENWIEQARILASGGATDFSRRADRG
jgi:predicted flap endonuclease-1-like 5' DNA nuclease